MLHCTFSFVYFDLNIALKVTKKNIQGLSSVIVHGQIRQNCPENSSHMKKTMMFVRKLKSILNFP